MILQTKDVQIEIGCVPVAYEVSLSKMRLCQTTRKLKKNLKKIRRGPKLEGYAFANFGYSSGTVGESRHEMKIRVGFLLKTV